MRAFGRFSIACLSIVCFVAANEPNPAVPAPAAPQDTAKAAPLFTFEEDGDKASFLPPRGVDFVRAPGHKGRSCLHQLSDHGNMWTGAEVERAFRDAAVQKALGGSQAPYAGDYPGKLTAGSASITWARACKKCQSESPA